MILKIFGFEKSGFFGLRMKYKLLLQIVLAVIIAFYALSKFGNFFSTHSFYWDF